MKLNLGSGYRKKTGFINIDNRPETYPDLLCNIEQGLPYEDGMVEEVQCTNFLEHLHQDKVIFAIEEIWRVLKNNGLFYSLTPSTEGIGAFMDFNHRSYWNLGSFLYFTDDAYRHLYGTKAKFQGEVQNVVIDHRVRNIIHVEAMMYAVK